MNRLNTPILFILIAFIAGIICYDYYTFDNQYEWILLGISLCTGLLLHYIGLKKRLSTTPFVFNTIAVFCLLGYITRQQTDDLLDQDHYTHLATGKSQTLLICIDEPLKPSAYQDKFIASVQTINNHRGTGRILLNISKDSTKETPRVGEWYYVRTPILKTPTPKNPYQFNYGNYLERKEIYGQLSISSHSLLRSEKSSWGLKVISSRFRESVQDSLRSQTFSSKQLAIIEALVLGQKQGIDKQMSAQYAASGMMHILAVSGLHVGIILLILRFIFKPITSRKWKWFKSLVIILLIWSFAFVTGLSPSVLRAAMMFSFLEFGEALGGKRKTTDAVLASALFLLLYDPLLIYQVGFQLSYLAVMSILWIQPWLSNFWEPRSYPLVKIRDVASVTIAAQLGVVPLSLFYFHQFPGLFFISNIIIIPFLGIILGGGILTSILAYVGSLPDFIVISYGEVIDLMNGFVAWVASQESFVTEHVTVSVLFMLSLYFMSITFILFLKKYTIKRLYALSVTILLFTIIILLEKRVPDTSHLAILNKSNTTMIATWDGKELTIYEHENSVNSASDSRINAYRNALRIHNIEQDSVPSYVRFKQQEILIVDSLSIFNLKEATPDYIVLTQSPKIHLERLISRYPKATIIADASNYRSYIERWKATCLQRKIPFHSTYEKGSFIIK